MLPWKLRNLQFSNLVVRTRRSSFCTLCFCKTTCTTKNLHLNNLKINSPNNSLVNSLPEDSSISNNLLPKPKKSTKRRYENDGNKIPQIMCNKISYHEKDNSNDSSFDSLLESNFLPSQNNKWTKVYLQTKASEHIPKGGFNLFIEKPM